MTIRHPDSDFAAREAHSGDLIILWRYHLSNALGHATISDELIASARKVHERLHFGDEPSSSTVAKVLAAMENEFMFGLCT